MQPDYQSFDWQMLYEQARLMWDVLWPVVIPAVGLTIGAGVMSFVANLIRPTAERVSQPVIKLNRYNTQDEPGDLSDPYDLDHADECDHCSAPFAAERPHRCAYCARVNR